MAWNKLYKLSLFRDNNIYYPVGKLHEDNFTTYKLYYYANKISLISDKLYYYIQRSNSIMGKAFNIKRLDALEAIINTKTFFKQKNVDIDNELDAYEAIIRIYLLDNMLRAKFKGKEKDVLIKDIILKKKIYLKNEYINNKMKFAIFILFQNAKIYELALLIFDILRRK